jgi:Tfp pilus assembly protein PilF
MGESAALVSWPDDQDLALHYADALQQAGLLEHAIATYKRILTKAPNNPAAWNNLGVSLQDSNRINEAVGAFDRAVVLAPDNAAIHNNLAFALLEHGDPERAERWLRKGIALDPSLPELHNNLGNVAREQGDVSEAVACYRRAIALRPDFADAHWNLSQGLLTLGVFVEGWREYEWRWKRPGFTSPRRDFPIPVWDGSEMRGRRLLIHAEQGMGDAIQFIRYCSVLQSLGVKVDLECHRELVRLFRTVSGITTVVPHGEPLPVCDAHIPMMSLPRVMRTTLETIPCEIPYLVPPPDLEKEWKERIGPGSGGVRVGIVWSGARKLKALLNRSCPLDVMLKLQNIPGVTLYSLQLGDAAAQLRAFPRSQRPVDLTESIVDMADTAAIVSHLDLVISIDTAVAHLGGAMGKPVWILLPRMADWRWMLQREDSPWYPTVRLFRQETAGDWPGLMAEVSSALSSRVLLSH